MAKHVQSGNAWEYALAQQLAERSSAGLNMDKTAIRKKIAYEKLSQKEKSRHKAAAKNAFDLIAERDGRIIRAVSVSMPPDDIGRRGDPTDVAVHLRGREIVRISAKKRNDYVKHQRIGHTHTWMNAWSKDLCECSNEYKDETRRIWAILRKGKQQGDLWDEMEKKDEEIYEPLCSAVAKEIERHADTQGFAAAFFQFLVGNHDYWKATLQSNGKVIVKVEPMNNTGTLASTQRTKPPTEILIARKKTGSSKRIEIVFNEHWALEMRLHNADKRVVPSLKLETEFTGMPKGAQAITRLIREEKAQQEMSLK